MASGIVGWFTPLDGIGEEAVDLAKCKRFVVSRHNRDAQTDGLTFLLNPREEGATWIRCSRVDDYDEDWNYVDVDTWQECHPEEVAHELLTRKMYGGRLPKDLEGFVEFGDEDHCRKWC